MIDTVSAPTATPVLFVSPATEGHLTPSTLPAKKQNNISGPVSNREKSIRLCSRKMPTPTCILRSAHGAGRSSSSKARSDRIAPTTNPTSNKKTPTPPPTPPKINQADSCSQSVLTTKLKPPAPTATATSDQSPRLFTSEF